MKKVLETIFLNYLNDGFEAVTPPKREMSRNAQKFYKLWDKLNADLSTDEQNENYSLMGDADYDSELVVFSNAFRLGFMLCAEVLMNE